MHLHIQSMLGCKPFFDRKAITWMVRGDLEDGDASRFKRPQGVPDKLRDNWRGVVLKYDPRIKPNLSDFLAPSHSQ
jgi:hypothetical protein